MPRGRPRKIKRFDQSKAVRLTIRLDEETVAMFKTVAAMKRMKLEELGKEAINDLIKKYLPLLKEFRLKID